MSPDASRQISEVVQGSQVSLCHIICRPDEQISQTLGLERASIGIMTLTPAEAAVIAADCITKTACVKLHFVDRYLGTLLVTGALAAVESAVARALELLTGMGFERVAITKS